jgi:BMFP domain-containing protein YqiC
MADDDHARVHELEYEAHEAHCREEHERLETRIAELEAELAGFREREHVHADEEFEEVTEPVDA